MPGRNGYQAQGGWAQGGSTNGLPASLQLDRRIGNQPSEYKASDRIDFVPGFTSGDSDNFDAYITSDNGSSDRGSGSSSKAGGYRYMFNGQERSTEIGDDTYGAEFWEYDSRIGRRWSVDPSPNVSISPYNCFAGNPIWYIDSRGDTLQPMAGFANTQTAYGKGLGLLLQGQTFKSALSSFDIGGSTSLTGNKTDGQYSSRINVKFVNCDDCETHTGMAFIDKNGKSTYTQVYNGITSEQPYVLSNLKDHADQFDASSRVEITVYRQNAYRKNDPATLEGVAFDVKHEVGVHGIVDRFLVAKGFVDGGVNGAFAASAKIGRLGEEEYSHGYAASGANLLYMRMGQELKPLFNSKQLIHYKKIAKEHFDRDGYVEAYRRYNPGPINKIMPSNY